MEESATATRSYSLTGSRPHAETGSCHKPVFIQQLPILAPTSQIRTGGGILFPPSGHPHEGTDSHTLSTEGKPPTHPAKTGSALKDDVNRNRETECYNGAKLVGPEVLKAVPTDKSDITKLCQLKPQNGGRSPQQLSTESPLQKVRKLWQHYLLLKTLT